MIHDTFLHYLQMFHHLHLDNNGVTVLKGTYRFLSILFVHTSGFSQSTHVQSVLVKFLGKAPEAAGGSYSKLRHIPLPSLFLFECNKAYSIQRNGSLSSSSQSILPIASASLFIF